MPTTKTAISVPCDLFKEMDQLSKRLRVPRSRLYALALREFIERRRADDLTERLNRAYAKGETSQERDFRQAATRAFRRMVEDTW